MKARPFHPFWLATAVVPITVLASHGAGDLAEPFRVEFDGKPIDVEVGHAAPLVADFDEDGKPDLLVGQFGGGKLRIFRNEGTDQSPKFKRFAWFQAGGGTGSVPAS